MIVAASAVLSKIRATSEPILDPVGRRTYTRNIWPKTRGRLPYLRCEAARRDA